MVCMCIMYIYHYVEVIIIKYREKGIMPVSPAHYNKQLH